MDYHQAKTSPYFDDDRFDEMIDKVRQFRDKEGHCRIPQDYEKDPVLGRWVKNRRSEQARGCLSKERKHRLDEIGFEWEVKSESESKC